MWFLISLAATFITILLAGHWALKRPTVRDNELLWIKVEYFWLMAALVTLASAARELWRLDKQLDLHTKNAALSQEWRNLRVETRARLEVGTVFMEGCPTLNPGETISTEDCRKARAWFQHAADALDLGVETEPWMDFLLQNADVDPVELDKPPGASRVPQMDPTNFERLPPNLPKEHLEAAHKVMLGMHKLDGLRSAAHNAEKETGPLWYDSCLRFIAPWFLAIALPVRLTKNTAQYLVARNKQASSSKLPTNANPPIDHGQSLSEEDSNIAESATRLLEAADDPPVE